MKKRFLNLLAIAIVSLIALSFSENRTTTQNPIKETHISITDFFADYTVDTDASFVTWKGTKPTGSHNGTIKLSEGNFTADKNGIGSGTFTMDMASLKDADGSKRLEGHLKSGDFFDVEKFPNSKFVVTGVSKDGEKTMLHGDLTLKDKTNSVVFPITISDNGSAMTISSETFIIDRSKWNVRYGSKSFFDNLGDKFISDDVELKINVVAKKS